MKEWLLRFPYKDIKHKFEDLTERLKAVEKAYNNFDFERQNEKDDKNDYIFTDYSAIVDEATKLFHSIVVNGKIQFSGIYKESIYEAYIKNVVEAFSEDTNKLERIMAFLTIAKMESESHKYKRDIPIDELISIVKEKLFALYDFTAMFSIDDILDVLGISSPEKGFGSQIGQELKRLGYVTGTNDEYKLTLLGYFKVTEEFKLAKKEDDILRNYRGIEKKLDFLIDFVQKHNFSLSKELEELKELNRNKTLSDKALSEVMIAKMVKIQASDINDNSETKPKLLERLQDLFKELTTENISIGADIISLPTLNS